MASQVAKDGVDEVRFAPAAPCAPGAAELCLLGNRFQVTVEWQTAQGQSGAGQALPLTATTGLFWFFAPANLDLVVKVVDGCALNGRTWVFAGGLTNVQVALHVLDTMEAVARSIAAGTFEPVATTFETPDALPADWDPWAATID